MMIHIFILVQNHVFAVSITRYLNNNLKYYLIFFSLLPVSLSIAPYNGSIYFIIYLNFGKIKMSNAKNKITLLQFQIDSALYEGVIGKSAFDLILILKSQKVSFLETSVFELRRAVSMHRH